MVKKWELDIQGDKSYHKSLKNAKHKVWCYRHDVKIKKYSDGSYGYTPDRIRIKKL